MSFEGYYQYLCRNGHEFTLDAYDQSVYFDDPENSSIKCPVCDAKVVWWNLVDVTNGSFDVNPGTDEEERIDGYVELEVATPPVVCICDKCGNEHTVEPTTYKIPEEIGCGV